MIRAGKEGIEWKADKVRIGPGTVIWQPELTNLYGCTIGRDCNIGAFVEIGPGVVIGDRVRIGAHCFIPEGVTIQDDVFIGPRVTFTNDRYPPGSKDAWEKTLVERAAAIGAGAIVLPGVVIGPGAMIGAGAIVARSVAGKMTILGLRAREKLIELGAEKGMTIGTPMPFGREVHQ